MKKLLFFLYLLSFFSCRQALKPAPKEDWGTYKKAYSLLSQQTDSAFYYFNKVTSNSKDSLPIALAYNNMAMIQSDAGDYYGAQESLTQSLKFLNENNPKHYPYLASDYNELGMNSSNLKNYEAAIGYYNKTLHFTNDSNLIALALNNQAIAFQETKNYRRAIALYTTIIRQSGNDSVAYARVLTNLAFTRWLQSTAFNAKTDLLKALRIRLEKNDQWGQNSSYAHLSDYYDRSHPDSALFYARAMYAVARQLNSPDDQVQALEKLIRNSPVAQTKNYFARYRALNDSIQTARNSAKNQFALIRYNVEKNKAENLKLQKDNSEKQYQIARQTIRFYITISVFIILGIVAIRWYRNKKHRQEHEKKEAILETQRKASKKVHDTLANDIYSIMKKVQHVPELNQDWLIDDIDDVYQRARDISHEMIPGSDIDFHKTISGLLQSFGSENTKVVIVGNSAEIWQKINTVYKFELKYILQELMVNMEKHSRANNVVIKFEERGDLCLITYFDNGIGLSDGHARQNGLINTGNRINSIKGTITFESSAGSGLEIKITFPIA
ncbi:tetratricopeptide repeat-containing sensor histidine kinase [Mucilaginibacter rubeus]|uniref:tetratricopeptide repeat-containing sensor histidine kinase n=1 Tax=Mucilaginibacter rubeus TaxID=2027860 RepID=UPI00166418D7|nr:ATP-binding protein [Mucilaginibacter rubeus]